MQERMFARFDEERATGTGGRGATTTIPDVDRNPNVEETPSIAAPGGGSYESWRAMHDWRRREARRSAEEAEEADEIAELHAANARIAFTRGKGTETPQFHPAAFGQALGNLFKENIDNLFDLFGSKIGIVRGKGLEKFRPYHLYPPKGAWLRSVAVAVYPMRRPVRS